MQLAREHNREFGCVDTISQSKSPISEPRAFSGKESELHKLIEAELKKRRWYYVHSRMDKASTQQAGVPDFVIAASDGITIWIEAKKKGNKLSKEQTITRHCLLALGHHYATVYCFADYEAALKLALVPDALPEPKQERHWEE